MKFMRQNGFEVTMVSSATDQKERLEKREESPFIAVNMTRTISPFKDLAALFKLIKLFKHLKPDIVHSHTPKAGLLGMMAAWYCRVPVRLHTVAGLPLMETAGIKRRVLEQVEKITYACAGRVYPNSNKLREFIIDQKFCKAGKLKVIGTGSSNGIDTEFFKLTPELEEKATVLKAGLGINPGDFVFIFIGRLVKDKGIEELITAFTQLSDADNKVKLILVGPTEPELDPLSAGCEEEINTNPRIIPVGYQGDVRPYLAVSDALVFPSYREGFPNVPMQAACFDLPSVVTDINGCNEIIEDGANGLIIPVKDAVALKTAMQTLLSNKELYAKMKSNARQMVVAHYEQKYFWNLLLKEYREQLKDNEIV